MATGILISTSVTTFSRRIASGWTRATARFGPATGMPCATWAFQRWQSIFQISTGTGSWICLLPRCWVPGTSAASARWGPMIQRPIALTASRHIPNITGTPCIWNGRIKPMPRLPITAVLRPPIGPGPLALWISTWMAMRIWSSTLVTCMISWISTRRLAWSARAEIWTRIMTYW